MDRWNVISQMDDDKMSFAADADPGSVNRRRWSRRLVSGTALVPVEIAPDGSFGLVVDLSEEGTAIQFVTPVTDKGAKVLTFTFPGTDLHVEVTGEIIWSNSNLCGIRFRDVSDQTRAALRAWINEKPKEPSSEETEFARVTVNPEVSAHTNGILATDDGLWVDFQLGLVAGQVRTSLAADGVAVAVLSQDRFVCRASLGNAPDFGAVLAGDAGLSAECIRTGSVVCCVDTRVDSRVNPDVCQNLRLGSAIVLPVKNGDGQIVAVVEVFWTATHAFNDSHLKYLDSLPADITAILRSGPKREESADAERFGNAGFTDFATVHQQSTSSVAESVDLHSFVIPQPAAAENPAVTLPSPDTATQTMARVIVLATSFLAILALLTGTFAWYSGVRPGYLSVSPREVPSNAQPSQEKAVVVLPEDSPELSAEQSDPQANREPRPNMVVTDIKVASPPDPGVARNSTGATMPAQDRTLLNDGTVLLDVTTDKDGRIIAVRAIRGDPKLVELAKRAVQGRRYTTGGLVESDHAKKRQITVSFGPLKKP